MKYEIKAKEDVNQRVGGHHFKVKKGKTLKLERSAAEMALQTGNFTFLEEVPVTKAEKEEIANDKPQESKSEKDQKGAK